MWSGSKPLPFGPDGAERLLHRRVQGRGLRLMARVGAMALAAAVLSAGALNLATILAAPQHEIVQSFATETTPQAWTEINHPIALYDLSGTEFAKLPRIARARRHQPDGAREDMLTFGAPGLPKPFLRLSVLRTTGHIGAAQDNLRPGQCRRASCRRSGAPRGCRQRECHGAAWRSRDLDPARRHDDSRPTALGRWRSHALPRLSWVSRRQRRLADPGLRVRSRGQAHWTLRPGLHDRQDRPALGRRRRSAPLDLRGGRAGSRVVLFRRAHPVYGRTDDGLGGAPHVARPRRRPSAFARPSRSQQQQALTPQQAISGSVTET